jgi:hypothetical protein
MKVKDILAELQKLDPEKSLEVSVDVSTGDADAGRRAYAAELFGTQDDGAYYTLLLGGILNDPK